MGVGVDGPEGTTVLDWWTILHAVPTATFAGSGTARVHVVGHREDEVGVRAVQ
jgi:hypothetical protein